MPANPSFSTLVATTLKNYRPQLADNITSHQALFFLLKEKGFFETKDGGESIVEPLLHEENSTVGSYRGYDIIDISPQEGISAAEYDWKQIAGTVSISGREEFQNSGSKQKVIDLLRGKVRQLEITMENEVNRQLFADGTGNSGKDITGLNLAVENGSAWSTYGGIDSSLAANAFWRNTWVDQAGGLALPQMRTVFNSSSRGNSHPMLMITTQSIFEGYETLVLANNDITRTDSKLGDAGFQNLLFKGVPMVFDSDCPAGVMFFLNPDFMRFVIGRGRDFVTTPMVKPDDQDSKLSQILLYCNLTINNRERQGRLDGIT